MKNTPTDPVPLPKRVRAYLDVLIRRVNQIAANGIISVLLFGSYVKGHPDPEKSDIDLVIVMDDKISWNKIAEINKLVEGLETAYGFSKPPKTRLERIFRAIEKATGMFTSHFICRKTDFLKGDFERIFSVSRTFRKLLAPSKLVFNAILSHVVTIYGDDISDKARKTVIDIRQWLKSLSMCFLLSLSGLLAFFLNKKAGKFLEEATKWSLFNTFYYVNRQSPSFQDIIEFYSKEGLRLAEDSLSPSGGFDIISAAKSPFMVIKIHVKGLRLLKRSSL